MRFFNLVVGVVLLVIAAYASVYGLVLVGLLAGISGLLWLWKGLANMSTRKKEAKRAGEGVNTQK